MIIFTKYSNERRPEFCIRTEIREGNGVRTVLKSAAVPQAWQHIEGMQEKYLRLKQDLSGTGLQVNACSVCREGAQFPYLTGKTMEEELDALLADHKIQELLEQIAAYFALFCEEVPGRKQTLVPFEETSAFTEVFGNVSFAQQQFCRAVSDIDMIFSNAVRTEEGYELIDYEWTFEFPVPVKFIMYRCLYYYVFGNAKRDILVSRDVFGHFGITQEEQEQFASMERSFQQYMLGGYTPIWKQYDDISDGVIDVAPLVQAESSRRQRRMVEVYFDDGRGYGIWQMRKYRMQEEGSVSLTFTVPEKTKRVRLDPCGERCVVRLSGLTVNGRPVRWNANGEQADNGDLIFDTEDPQIEFDVPGGAEICAEFLAEPLDGIARELVLAQHGKLRWMEQTKAWRLYQKLKGRKG